MMIIMSYKIQSLSLLHIFVYFTRTFMNQMETQQLVYLSFEVYEALSSWLTLGKSNVITTTITVDCYFVNVSKV